MTNRNFLWVLLLAVLPLSAKQRSEAEMARIAQNALSLPSTRATTSLTKLDESDNYTIYGNNEGFAVISKDDTFQPVWGYSYTRFDKNNLPDGFKWWLSAVEATLNNKAPKKNIEGNFTPEEIKPLIKSKWAQGDPYNTLCPTLGGKKGVTGCVATALAQILNYYQYPSEAHGKGYYTLGANSSPIYRTIDSKYNWSLLMDNYASAWFLSDEEKQAIGQLMFDAGVACHMNYASDGSGTTVYEAGNALSQVFQCDSLSTKCVLRAQCKNDGEWMNIILNELKNKRPVYMGAQSPLGGHAFILDGMDKDGKAHFNWGWGGSQDGYYEINNLNPSSYHFDYSQNIITNIRLNPTPTEDEEFRSCWTASSEYNIIDNGLNGLTVSFKNEDMPVYLQNCHLTFYGKIGLEFLDANGNEAFFHTFIDTSDKKNGYSPVSGGMGYYASYFSNISVSDLAALPAGKYRIFLASKAVQDKTPQFICYPGGDHHEYDLTKAADNSLTIQEATTAVLSPTVTMKVNDNKIYDLQGRRLSTSFDALPKGIYIKNGKKVTK